MFLLAIAAVSVSHIPHSKDLIKELAKRQFTPDQAIQLLLKPELQTPLAPVDEQFITWAEMQERMLAPESLQRGRQIMAKYEMAINYIREKYPAVPPEAVLGLARLESDLGRNPGLFEAYKLLYRGAVARTKEKVWKLAASRFAALAGYCRDSQINCFNLLASRAGALGLVQFMPDTLERYGSKIRCLGPVDLMFWDDALVSAARFLTALGWAKNPDKALRSYYGKIDKYDYPTAVLNYAQALGADPAKLRPAKKTAKPPKNKTKKPARTS